MNSARCNACNSNKLKKLFLFKSGELITNCKECGSISSFNQVGQKQLYSRGYFINNYENIVDVQAERFRSYFVLIDAFRNAQTGSLLDIGCGTGLFIKTSQDFGYSNNCGVDASDYALAMASEKLGDDVVLKMSLDADVGKFDLITLVDSVAHIDNLRVLLNLLRLKHMHNSSLLFIRTPSFNMPYLWFAYFLTLLTNKKLGKLLYFYPTRNILFSRLGLQLLLAQEGFDVIFFKKEYPYRRKKNVNNLKDLLIKSISLLGELMNPKSSMIVIARVQNRDIR